MNGVIKREDVLDINGYSASVYVAEFNEGFKLVLSILPNEGLCPIERDEASQYHIIVQESGDFYKDVLFDEHGARFISFMSADNIETIDDHYLRLALEHFPLVMEECGNPEYVPVLTRQVWDNETQAYWPITQWNGRYWGFPNSTRDGTPIGHMAFLGGYHV